MLFFVYAKVTAMRPFVKSSHSKIECDTVYRSTPVLRFGSFRTGFLHSIFSPRRPPALKVYDAPKNDPLSLSPRLGIIMYEVTGKLNILLVGQKPTRITFYVQKYLIGFNFNQSVSPNIHNSSHATKNQRDG